MRITSIKTKLIIYFFVLAFGLLLAGCIKPPKKPEPQEVSISAIERKVNAFRKKGLYDGALEMLDEKIKSDPDNIKLLGMRVQVITEGGMHTLYDKAVADLTTIVKKRGSVTDYLRRADMYYFTKKKRKAMADAEKAYETDRKNKDALVMLASLTKDSDKEGALSYLALASRYNPNDSLIYSLQGMLLLEEKNKENVLKARELFQKALARNPNSLYSYLGMAIVSRDLGKWDEAKRFFRISKTNWSVLLKKSKYPTIEGYYAFTTWIDFQNVNEEYAEYYTNMGEFKKALEIINNKIKNDDSPYSLLEYAERGFLLKMSGENKKADEAYRKFMKSVPKIRKELLPKNEEKILFILEYAGNAYQAMGKYDKAIKAYNASQKAIDEPAQREQYDFLKALVYYKRGDVDKARSTFKNAGVMAEQGWYRNYFLASKYTIEGKPKEALPYLEDLIKIQPKNTLLRFLRGNAYLDLKEYDKADSDFEFVIENETEEPMIERAKKLKEMARGE